MWVELNTGHVTPVGKLMSLLVVGHYYTYATFVECIQGDLAIMHFIPSLSVCFSNLCVYVCGPSVWIVLTEITDLRFSASHPFDFNLPSDYFFKLLLYL